MDEREIARRDLLYFAGEILGYAKPRDPTRPSLSLRMEEGSAHAKLVRFIEEADSKGVTESLVLMPRGFMKTTIGTIAYPLWCLARAPDEAILLLASTLDKAKMFLSEVKDHLESNVRLHELFPDLRPHPRGPWQSDRIRISGRMAPRKETSITAMSLEQGRAGGHYDRIICDDLHDEVNSSTADLCQGVIGKYATLRPLLVPGRGEIRVTGTRWHGADLYGWMLEQNELNAVREKPPRVRVRAMSLYREDGSPSWPEVFGPGEIEKLKAESDPEFFASQYLNDPYMGSHAIFRKADIERAMVSLEEIPKELVYFAACDPGFAQNKWNDFSAIVVWGVYHTKHAFVVDIFNERVETAGLIDAMYGMYGRWKWTTLSVEATSTQLVMDYAMREAQKERGFMPWRPLHRGGGHSALRGKQRIRRLEPLLRNGTLKFSKNCPNIGILVRQLQDYPKGAHDDVIDALADFPEISWAPTSPGSVRVSREVLEGVGETSWQEWRKLSRNRPGSSFDGVGHAPDNTSVVVGIR